MGWGGGGWDAMRWDCYGVAFLHDAIFGWEAVVKPSDGHGLLDQPLERRDLAPEVELSCEQPLAAAAVLQLANVLTHARGLRRRGGNAGLCHLAHTTAVQAPATRCAPVLLFFFPMCLARVCGKRAPESGERRSRNASLAIARGNRELLDMLVCVRVLAAQSFYPIWLWKSASPPNVCA